MLIQSADQSIYFDTGTRTTMPFRVFIGARGCGKTYSTLRNLLIENDKLRLITAHSGKFIYLRRTSKEIELSSSEIANPFKVINRDFGIDATSEFNGKLGISMFHVKHDDIESLHVGYGLALSTFANLRGMDFSDVDTIVFDEFMQEKSGRKVIKDEGNALLHLYETVNRNRELEGRPPVTLYLMGNAISLDSEILLALGATKTLSMMLTKQKYRATLRERNLYLEIILLDNFKHLKAQTALYGLSKGSDFSKQALDNEFVNTDFTFVKKVPISEYKPIINYGSEYTIYQHKSRPEFYASSSINIPARNKFPITMRDKFKMSFRWTYASAILDKRIYFDDYATKLILDAIML